MKSFILAFIANLLGDLIIIGFWGSALGLAVWGGIHWFATLLVCPTVSLGYCLVGGLLVMTLLCVFVEAIQQFANHK